MSKAPYVDSIWATKKRQIPFMVGNVTIIWESSYGMTLRNPGQMESAELRGYLDDAIERAFDEDLEKFTNNKAVRTLIDHAGMYVDPDAEYQVGVVLEGPDAVPVTTSVMKDGEREIVHMTLDELIKSGHLTKGVKGGGND